jgi:hypothetical protein
MQQLSSFHELFHSSRWHILRQSITAVFHSFIKTTWTCFKYVCWWIQRLHEKNNRKNLWMKVKNSSRVKLQGFLSNNKANAISLHHETIKKRKKVDKDEDWCKEIVEKLFHFIRTIVCVGFRRCHESNMCGFWVENNKHSKWNLLGQWVLHFF